MVRASTLPALAGVLLVLAVPASPARAQVTRVLVRTVHTGPKEALDPLLNQVAFQGGRRAAFLITRALGDRDPDVRDRAAYALGILAVHGTERALEKVVDDPDWSVRRDAIFALGSSATGGPPGTSPGASPTPSGRRAWRRPRPCELAIPRGPGPGRGPEEGRGRPRARDGPPEGAGPLPLAGRDPGPEGHDPGWERGGAPGGLRALASMGQAGAALAPARLDGPSAYARVDAARLLGQVPGHWSDGALRTALTDAPPRCASPPPRPSAPTARSRASSSW